jgi:murein L,D-transpeptidase YcbB/YkuD
MPLLVAASLLTLAVVTVARSEDATPRPDDLAATLATPLAMPQAAPDITAPAVVASQPTTARIDPATPAAPAVVPVAPAETARPAAVPPAAETVPAAVPTPVQTPVTPAEAAQSPVTPPVASPVTPVAAPAAAPVIPTSEPPAAAPTAPAVIPAAAPAEPPQPSAAELAAKAAAEAAAATRAAFAAELKTAIEAIDLKSGSADERRDRAAVQAFYRLRDGAPLFLDGHDVAAVGRAVGAAFAKAAEDGLDPHDYALEPPPADAGPAAFATAELAYAEAALHYARDASGGRIPTTRISPLITPKIVLPDPATVLAKLADSPDATATLIAYNPPHEGYKRLKAKLAAMRVNPEPPPPPQVIVPAGPSLKPGASDPRVVQLRQRFAVPLAEGADPELYDDVLVAQVRLFQKERGLGTSGLVGPATLAALNKVEPPRIATEADIIVNMERWRWLPRDLGALNVMVNIPGFYLDINRDGHRVHRTRVIVGRTQNQTPIFSEAMSHIIVNPYWNVPLSILKKEMMGDIQASGGASLDRGNYEVLINDRVVASSDVDWATVNPAAVHVRQRPGGGNALGNVKFMFPNQHSVYLHDTSSRSLFSQDYRSLSHGCVRVFEPFVFANKLLAGEPTGIDGDKLKAMVGGAERTMWLKVKPVVHLTYFTTTVDDDGHLTFRRDLYGHDARMKQLLKL